MPTTEDDALSEALADLRLWLEGQRSTNNYIRGTLLDNEAETRLIHESDNAQIIARAAMVTALATHATTFTEGLPDCEGWTCQSCGADNFIPPGFARVTPSAETDRPTRA